MSAGRQSAVSSFELCSLSTQGRQSEFIAEERGKGLYNEGEWLKASLFCAFLVLRAREASGGGNAAEDSVTQLYVKVMNDLKIKYNAGDLEQKLESLN